MCPTLHFPYLWQWTGDSGQWLPRAMLGRVHLLQTSSFRHTAGTRLRGPAVARFSVSHHGQQCAVSPLLHVLASPRVCYVFCSSHPDVWGGASPLLWSAGSACFLRTIHLGSASLVSQCLPHIISLSPACGCDQGTLQSSSVLFPRALQLPVYPGKFSPSLSGSPYLPGKTRILLPFSRRDFQSKNGRHCSELLWSALSPQQFVIAVLEC
jgi:hypothetical protein